MPVLPVGDHRPRRTLATVLGPAFGVWVLLSVLTQLPYLVATLAPPPGKEFVGVFYYIDDQYNYLSYAQQAEHGRFLFDNALVLAPHPRRLINLEWWGVGRVSALLGGRPLLAWRLLALGASLALLLGIDRFLRDAGLPDSHRSAGLILVTVGAGLGGVAWQAGVIARTEAVDMIAGLFPFVEMLANPHFVAGTALLVAALWALAGPATWKRQALGAALGSALAFVRPYDLFVLGAAAGVGGLLGSPRREWLTRLLALASMLPAAAYVIWVLLPWFGSYGVSYYAPPARGLALAFGPAAALAAFAARVPADSESRRYRLALAAWATIVALIQVFRPVDFALQFAVGSGLPLLALGAIGLSRWRPAVTLTVALVFFSTGAVSLHSLYTLPYWYVPAERMQIARAARETCRLGDVAMAPADIGHLLAGLTACKPYVSHVVAPDFAARASDLKRFYGPASADARASFLDTNCIAAVVLPLDGDVPRSFLGPDTPYRRVATAGSGAAAIALYSRVDRSRCSKGAP